MHPLPFALYNTMTEEFRTFVEENINESPVRLRMRMRGDSRAWIPLAVSHIEALGKGRKKYPSLPDSWIFPSVTAVEQSTPLLTAEYNFSVAAKAVGRQLRECRILDMTAGMGMDALGFADSGADLTLIELNPIHAQALAVNFERFWNVTVTEGDSVKWLSEYSGPRFDIVFIDPARRTESGARAYNLHHCTPDLIELSPLILERAEVCIAKLSPMLDITQTLRDLPHCRELHVVEEGGECRELLAVISSHAQSGNCSIIVHKEGLTINYDAGAASPDGINYAMPRPGMYLLEPSPAIAKGLPASRICGYGVAMLAPNTHMFVGDAISDPGLGRWSHIEAVLDFAGSRLKRIGTEIGAAEVVARNLPGMTSESLRKRLGVKESSERRIIGTSLADGSKVLLLCGKRL